MKSLRTGACLIALAFPCLWQAHAAEEVPQAAYSDCGTVALYYLLHLEGRPVDFDRLRSSMGAPTPEGYSFRELREAAGRFGLDLDAVLLPKRTWAIDRPILLFVKTDHGGHYLVARPVGHTGSMVQLLDGDRPPTVGDAEWLFASTPWTGLALVPRRTNYLSVAALTTSAGCMAAFVILRWKRRRQLSTGRMAVAEGIR